MNSKITRIAILIFVLVFAQVSKAQIAIFNPTSTIAPIGVFDSPDGEGISKIIDGNSTTKALDFEFIDGLGFDVSPSSLSTVNQLSITTANDAPSRDPQNFTIYGSMDGLSYELITNGTIPCDAQRFLTRNFTFSNTNAYAHYRLIFKNRCSTDENSLQIADVQLFGTVVEVLPPNAEEFQEVCSGSTLADLVVSGANLTWYDAPSNGTILPNSQVVTNNQTYYVTQTIDRIESEPFGITVSISSDIQRTTNAESCYSYFWSANETTYFESGTYSFTNNCITETLELVITNNYITNYVDADGDGFGDDNAQIDYCVPLEGYVLVGGDCDDANPAIHPNATEICGDGIDNNCNGSIDENCGLTSIQSSQCGSVLSKINDYIYANIVPGAQAYRFRVTNEFSDEPQFIDRMLRVFQLTQLPSYRFDTTYYVQVDVRLNGVWQNNYGSICEIYTPEVVAQMEAASCGQIFSNKNTNLYAQNIPFVTGYMFRVTNITTQDQYLFERPIRSLNLSRIPDLTYGNEYTIEVAARNTNGSYMDYGLPCSFIYDAMQTKISSSKNNTIASDALQLIAYPNPFDSNFTVEIKSENPQNNIVKVYDITGQLIEEIQIDSVNTELHLGENLPSGVYLITVTDDVTVKSVKMIKR